MLDKIWMNERTNESDAIRLMGLEELGRTINSGFYCQWLAQITTTHWKNRPALMNRKDVIVHHENAGKNWESLNKTSRYSCHHQRTSGLFLSLQNSLSDAHSPSISTRVQKLHITIFRPKNHKSSIVRKLSELVIGKMVKGYWSKRHVLP